jgi:hypothetical protein
MKTTLPFLLAFFFFQTPELNAQSFTKGQKDLNIGIGFGSRYYTRASFYSNYSSTPVISIALEVGVTEEISVGGYFGFASSKWEYSGGDFCNNGNGNGGGFYNYTDTYHWNFYMLGVRGAYHFAKLIQNDKIDLYAGAMLGDNFARYTFSTTAPCPEHHAFYGTSYYGGFIFTGLLGCRYHINEHFGAFAELGYGVSYLTAGLNYKF